jgi:serine/threonine protein kinase
MCCKAFYLLSHRNQVGETVVIKGVRGHPRVENERDVLKRFQHRTSYLRTLIDEIEEPSEPPTIVLRCLEDHLLNASMKKPLNRQELKYVSRRILEALQVLHEDSYAHTGNFFTCQSSRPHQR